MAGLREAMRERRALLRVAPELVRPLGFLVPAYGHGAKGREALAVGLWLNDRLTPYRNAGLPESHRLPPARSLSRADVQALVPGLPAARLTGGVLWHDAQVSSSERLVLGWLHAAAEQGAALANRAPVVALLRCRERVVGAIRSTRGACDGCGEYLGCHGGCRGMAYLASGTFEAPDPACPEVGRPSDLLAE